MGEKTTQQTDVRDIPSKRGGETLNIMLREEERKEEERGFHHLEKE